MSHSAFSSNPLLRVSRPVSACSRCRAAKVKCDGKLPACTACERAGREKECSAANDQFARGKERSYVAALELRIEKLEKRLQYAKLRKDSVAFHDPDTTSNAQPDRRDSLAAIRAAIYRKAARVREDSDVNSLVSDFGFLSVNATMRDFEPSVTDMTFARLVLAATCNDPISPAITATLPPRPAALDLIQYYMANIYVLFPSFSETALLTTLDDVYQKDDRTIKDSDSWLLYMVFAISSTARSRKLHDECYRDGVGFVAKALEYADGALTPGNVSQIQSMLLLTIYSMLDLAHFDSWHLIGFTARSIVDLGFHQDPPMASVADRASLDLRRKIFYSVYALDRAISMVHARPFSFTDDTVSVAFPDRGSSDRKASTTGRMSPAPSTDAALLLFQLRRAQSHWYQELYQSNASPLADPEAYVWHMCLDMREWGESLPGGLSAGLRCMFEQELRYSYVYCIAPSARTPQITDYGRTLIFEYSLAYLDVMYDVSQDVQNSTFYTYHDALKVYFMANQFLAVLKDAEEMLLIGADVQVPSPRPGAVTPPPIPSRSSRMRGIRAEDNLTRALDCLEQTSRTLARYGERWGNALMLKNSFETISEDVAERLRSRNQMRDARRGRQSGAHQRQYSGQSQGIRPAASSSPPQAAAAASAHGHAKDMRWADLGMAPMMQGGRP